MDLTLSDEERMILMFEETFGKPGRNFSIEIMESDDGLYSPSGIQVMKHGNPSWSITKAELVFDYITKDWMRTNDENNGEEHF
ncbi:MAG: hypothetical protein KUG81_05815 [Gammaproteobacteria bacterium]|nr:hypothetical protein [Gammaproteobacteria bacterium]